MTAHHLLVVNADDLGLAPGVNRGIIEAHDAGTLSSASMMVNVPAFPEAVSLARARRPRLGVGLHLNLVSGRPLTDAVSLTDARTGNFHPLAELARRALTGRVRADDVRRECDAQLRALVTAGISPTHLDSHRHAHALPGILPAVAASAYEAGLHWVRRPLDHPALREPAASAKMLLLHAAWRRALIDVDEEHLPLLARAPHFRGIALQGGHDIEGRLLALLDRLPGGATELMLHPGYDDATLAAQDPYRSEREREVAALCSPAVRARLAQGDIRLVNFADL
ncbi:MAG TPA: ChbG/HpnK family deacetylase [Gemmatimonadaceae bacterium]|nr:ChbG/HpnK family deacetylase [Gemmatimonadaceae bacterium]